jgi:hypothetical protein
MSQQAIAASAPTPFLRRVFDYHAALLANRGYDLRLIEDYLGHRDPKHTVHYPALPPDASRAFGVESGRFHAEGDQTFTVLERWAFFTKFLVDGGSGAIMLDQTGVGMPPDDLRSPCCKPREYHQKRLTNL